MKPNKVFVYQTATGMLAPVVKVPVGGFWCLGELTQPDPHYLEMLRAGSTLSWPIDDRARFIPRTRLCQAVYLQLYKEFW